FRPGRGAGLIRGSFVDFRGRGIAEATVSITPQPQIRVPGAPPTMRPWFFGACLIDDSGQFVLIVPDSRDYPQPQPALPSGNMVDVLFINAAVSTTVAGVPFVLGAETTLQQTALRGSVLSRGSGIGNATVQIQGEANAAPTAADGSWVYYFGLNLPGLPPAS